MQRIGRWTLVILGSSMKISDELCEPTTVLHSDPWWDRETCCLQCTAAAWLLHGDPWSDIGHFLSCGGPYYGYFTSRDHWLDGEAACYFISVAKLWPFDMMPLLMSQIPSLLNSFYILITYCDLWWGRKLYTAHQPIIAYCFL